MEIKKFNGKHFELWNLKMQYMLVEKDQWITMDLGTSPTVNSIDDWKKLDQKAKRII
jgi:hypothetical protein